MALRSAPGLSFNQAPGLTLGLPRASPSRQSASCDIGVNVQIISSQSLSHLGLCCKPVPKEGACQSASSNFKSLGDDESLLLMPVLVGKKITELAGF